MSLKSEISRKGRNGQKQKDRDTYNFFHKFNNWFLYQAKITNLYYIRNMETFSEKGCDVLLYGTMGNIGETALRALASCGLNVRKVDFPQNTFRDEFGYRRGLGKALDTFSPGMAMPVGNTLAMARFKPTAPEGIRIPVDTEEKIRLLDSKVESSRLAASLNIPQPHIYGNIDEVGENQVIFKREKSFGGSGVYKPKTKESLLNLMEHEPGSRYLIEDFIEGTDFSVDAVRWNGYFRAGCYKALSNRGQGPAISREKTDFPVLEEYAFRILSALDYNGVCGMDFRVDADGNAWFLECNPRFTGGLELQLENGFNIPYILYSLTISDRP